MDTNKVYIVWERERYEAGSLRGVFTTPEKAEACKTKCENSRTSLTAKCWYEVESVDLDTEE